MRRFFLALWLAASLSVGAAAAEEVIPMGRTVGIRMTSDCVLVTKLTSVETTEGTVSPASPPGFGRGISSAKSVGRQSPQTTRCKRRFPCPAASP